MTARLLRLAALVAALVLVPAGASAQGDQQKLVNTAAATVESLRADPHYAAQLEPLIAGAKAVLVVPELIKAGFILGGEYGMGVMLARRGDGQWSYPAFYTLAAGSFGLQAGFQDAEVVFAVMTEKGLAALMNNAVKFGADLGITLFAIGGGFEASTTTNLNADVIAFSRSVGIFGGGSLEGAVLKPRATWNAAYYGGAVTPEVILLGGAENTKADALRAALGR